jgi:processive 1,2-diacylglycerol beta-glucosyltransferase
LSPDIIINTHHLPLGMVSFWRQHNKVEVPLSLAVLTDYSGHRFWVHPRVDRYYVATREVGAYIEAQGVSPALIKPFGIPIGEQFQKRLDSQKLRARYHLDRDMPTVLLIVDNIEKIFLTKMIQSLLRFKPALQGFIIAGMPKTRALLETALKGSRHRLRVIDRVPNLEEYCSLADVLVSKAGGLTIAETLALGLPLLIVNPIMGQEETNRNFLLEQGAALNVEIPDLLEYKLNLFFHDAALRTRLCKNIAALARPRAAEDTAADIISLAENKL